MIQVNDVSFDTVCPKGTMGAALFPARVKHEVINDELASSVEEFS
jgi:hypothetical protein